MTFPSQAVLAVLLISSAAAQAADQCSTTLVAQSNSSYDHLRSSFLQIYRTVRVPCTGNVQSWTFRCDNITLPQLPIFSVWDYSQNAKGDSQYKLIGSTPLKRELLQAQGKGWYNYPIPEAERFIVDTSRLQFIGVFYALEVNQSAMATVHYQIPKFIPKADIGGWKGNTTIVAYMSQLDIIGNMTTKDNFLVFNPLYMEKDLRYPFIQLAIDGTKTTTVATTTTPSPSTPTPTTPTTPTSTPTPTTPVTTPTTSKTTPRPKTTKAPKTTTTATVTTTATTKITTTVKKFVPAVNTAVETPPTPSCGDLPVIANCEPSQAPTGVIGERIAYHCNYSTKVAPGVRCNSNGKWVGSVMGRAKQHACGMAVKVGNCQEAIPSWFFDRDTRICHPFFYSGCGGNANRFRSRTECVTVCGASITA